MHLRRPRAATCRHVPWVIVIIALSRDASCSLSTTLTFVNVPPTAPTVAPSATPGPPPPARHAAMGVAPPLAAALCRRRDLRPLLLVVRCLAVHRPGRLHLPVHGLLLQPVCGGRVRSVRLVQREVLLLRQHPPQRRRPDRRVGLQLVLCRIP